MNSSKRKASLLENNTLTTGTGRKFVAQITRLYKIREIMSQRGLSHTWLSYICSADCCVHLKSSPSNLHFRLRPRLFADCWIDCSYKVLFECGTCGLRVHIPMFKLL